MKSAHFIAFVTNRHSVPLLIMAFGHMTILVVMVVANEWMKRAGFTIGQVDLEIDEDLPNFFESVTLRQANEVVNTHNFLKKQFHFE